jgi:hypothetical protein
MHQLIVNIKDESKLAVLLNFLKSLNYISVEHLEEGSVVLSESEKEIMRDRLKNAKPENFKAWKEVKNTLK